MTLRASKRWVFLCVAATSAAWAAPKHTDPAKVPAAPAFGACAEIRKALEDLCVPAPGQWTAALVEKELKRHILAMPQCVDAGELPSGLLAAVRYELNILGGFPLPEEEKQLRRWITELRIHWRLNGRERVSMALTATGHELEKSALKPPLRALVRWLREHLEGNGKAFTEKDVEFFSQLPMFEPTLPPLGNVCGHVAKRHWNYMYDARFPAWELALGMALGEADAAAPKIPDEIQKMAALLAARDQGLVRTGSLTRMLRPVVDKALAKQVPGIDVGDAAQASRKFTQRLALVLWPATRAVLSEAIHMPRLLFSQDDERKAGTMYLPFDKNEVLDIPGEPQLSGFLFGSLLVTKLPAQKEARELKLRIDGGTADTFRTSGGPIFYPQEQHRNAKFVSRGKRLEPEHWENRSLQTDDWKLVEDLLRFAHDASGGDQKKKVQPLADSLRAAPDRYLLLSSYASDSEYRMGDLEEAWVGRALRDRDGTLEKVDPAVLARRVAINPLLQFHLEGRKQPLEPWLLNAYLLADQRHGEILHEVMKSRTVPDYLQSDFLEEAVGSLRGVDNGHASSAEHLTPAAQRQLEPWIPRALDGRAKPIAADVSAILRAPHPSDAMLAQAATDLLRNKTSETGVYLYGKSLGSPETRKRFAKVFWTEFRRRELAGEKLAFPNPYVVVDLMDEDFSVHELWTNLTKRIARYADEWPEVRVIVNEANREKNGAFEKIRRNWDKLPESVQDEFESAFSIQYSQYPKKLRGEIATLLESRALKAIEKGQSYFALNPRTAHALVVKNLSTNPPREVEGGMQALRMMEGPAPGMEADLLKYLAVTRDGNVAERLAVVRNLLGPAAALKYVDEVEKRTPGTLAAAIFRVSEKGFTDREAMRALSERVARAGQEDFGKFGLLQEAPKAVRQRVAEMLLARTPAKGWESMALWAFLPEAELEALVKAALNAGKNEIAMQTAEWVVKNRNATRDFGHWLLETSTPESRKSLAKVFVGWNQ